MSTVPVDTNDYAGLFGKLFPASEPLPGQGDSLELLKKLAKINEEEQKALLDDLVALLGQKGGKDASSLTEEKKEQKKENQAKERKNKKEQKDAKVKDNSQENKYAGQPVPQPPSIPLVCGQLNREGRPCQRKEGPLHCPYHGSLREQKPLAKQFKESAGTHPIPPDSLPKIGPDPVPSKVRPADQTQPLNAKLPWSMEEHIKFLKGLKRWGTGSIAAEQIAKYIGTRSVNAVKNYSQRYHEYHRRGVKLPNNNYNFTLEDFVMQKRRRREVRRCGSEGDTPNRESDIDKHTPQKQKTLTLFGFQIAVDKKDTGVSTGVVSTVDKGRDSASSGHEDEDEEDEADVHSRSVGNVYGNGVKEESEWNRDSVSSHKGGEEDGSEKDTVGVEVEETFIDDFVFLAVKDVDAFGQYQHPMPFLQGREDFIGNSASTASNARNHSGVLPLAANVEKRLTRSASRQVPRHHSSSGLDSGATEPVNRGERKRKLAQTVRTGVKRLKQGELETDSDKVFLPPIREKEWQLKMEQETESPIPTSLTTQSIQYLSSPSAPPDISVVSARLFVSPLPTQPQLLRQLPFPPSTSPSAITPVPLTYNCAPSSPTACIQQSHRRPGPFLSSNTQRMAFVKVCTAPSSRMQPETPHNRTEVEAIDGVRRTADGVEYFVKWKGTSPKENTWEPRDRIKRLWPQGNFADWDLF